MADCFRATGCGSVSVARRAPDGKITSAFCNIELMGGGILNMFAKEDHPDEADVDKLVKEMSDVMPPMVPGDEQLAARYTWGAYAWSLDQGYSFPGAEHPYLSMVPKLGGSRNWWLQQLTTGPDALVPQELADVIDENQPDEDLPGDKEIVILTTATFELADRQDAIDQLIRNSPEFTPTDEDDESITFDFSRKYPKDHWSPLRLLGGRQSLGSVIVQRDCLVGECKTLSMTARLIARLKGMFGETIHLRETKWKGAQELIREMRAENDPQDDKDDLLDIDPNSPAA